MAEIGAVVFDLDGTLVDSRADIGRAINATLLEYGRPALELGSIVAWVGDGARALVARSFGVDSPAHELDAYLASYLAHYAAHPAEATTLMPGASEALAALADWPLAVCTNKPRSLCELVLDELGVRGRFSLLVGGGDVVHPKPHPESLLQTAQALGVRPSSLVMVGDGPQDVECGQAVGARTVGVRGGFLPVERLLGAKPDRVIDSLFELPRLVLAWAGLGSGSRI